MLERIAGSLLHFKTTYIVDRAIVRGFPPTLHI